VNSFGAHGLASAAAGRGPIDLSGTFHVQSFVDTLVVEDLGKFVKAGLLKKVCGGRLSRFFFQEFAGLERVKEEVHDTCWETHLDIRSRTAVTNACISASL